MREYRIGQHPISPDYFKERIGPETRVGIFIDAPNLNDAIKIMGLRQKNTGLDYMKLKEFLVGRGELAIARYYTAKSFSRWNPPFLAKMREFGYGVVEDTVNPVTGKPASTDTSLVADLCLDVSKYEVAHIVSGDKDFAYPIERLVGDFGKRVYILTAEEKLAIELREVERKLYPNVQILLLDECYQWFSRRRPSRRKQAGQLKLTPAAKERRR